MSQLISGKEAAILYLNGENVLHLNKDMVETNNQWADCKGMNIDDFKNDRWAFKLKPQTVTLNGIEVPASFEPKIGDKYWILEVSDPNSYSYISTFDGDEQDKNLIKLGAWRTEEEIKQVVEALRSIFK